MSQCVCKFYSAGRAQNRALVQVCNHPGPASSQVRVFNSVKCCCLRATAADTSCRGQRLRNSAPAPASAPLPLQGTCGRTRDTVTPAAHSQLLAGPPADCCCCHRVRQGAAQLVPSRAMPACGLRSRVRLLGGTLLPRLPRQRLPCPPWRCVALPWPGAAAAAELPARRCRQPHARCRCLQARADALTVTLTLLLLLLPPRARQSGVGCRRACAPPAAASGLQAGTLAGASPQRSSPQSAFGPAGGCRVV
jgi:hypothetical protein